MFETIIGIILLVAAVFLIVSVLFQNSKSHKLPGTISGGAETFFGKTKGSKIDTLLEKLTTVVAIIFCVLVLVMYIGQKNDVAITPSVDGTDTAVTTGADTGDETTAADTTDAETTGADTTAA